MKRIYAPGDVSCKERIIGEKAPNGETLGAEKKQEAEKKQREFQINPRKSLRREILHAAHRPSRHRR